MYANSDIEPVRRIKMLILWIFGIVSWIAIGSAILLLIAVFLLPLYEKCWRLFEVSAVSLVISFILLAVFMIILFSIEGNLDCSDKAIPLWGFLE